MKKNDLYLYIVLSLSFLIPFPGRFAYGLVMVLLLNFLVLTGVLLKSLISLIFVDDMQNVILVSMMIGICILFKQFLVLYSPIMAMTLGYLIFMPVFSSFILGGFYVVSEKSLVGELTGFLKKSGIYSLNALAFYLFRDVVGYGTITLPSPGFIFEIDLWKNWKYAYMGSFFASIPGSLILLVMCISYSNRILNNLEIVDTSNAIGGKNAQ